HLATDRLGREVAVKRLALTGTAAEIETARRRIRREAEMLAAVDHPSIVPLLAVEDEDRKSTRLNSSHDQNSYAVFCLKKKTKGVSSLDPSGLLLEIITKPYGSGGRSRCLQSPTRHPGRQAGRTMRKHPTATAAVPAPV